MTSRAASFGAALAATLLAGCYLHHGGRASRRDAGDRPDATSPRDSGTDAGRDAGSLEDGGGFCTPIAAQTACVAGDHAPFWAVDAPNTLSVWTGGCHCGGRLVCRATDVRPASPGAAGAIALSIELCDAADCAACTGPQRVDCALPPLPEGEYRVSMEGGPPRFVFYAMRFGGSPPTSLCQHVGSDGGGLCDWPGELLGWEPTRVCYAERSASGRVVIELEREGTGCHLEPGPCDLFVGEGPSGRGFEIRPRIRSCDEGGSTWGCAGMSGTLRRTCSALDVEPGVYTLQTQHGRLLGEIEVVADGPSSPASCRDLP